ncbi:type II and III secretion system protein family protein [Sphingobium chlorophenolicum]|uniref:type II and III secretion system protein family protein n=1 Tax=Sphingobium chlorophenolicum TaxID=46429 RepID=UPI0020B7C3BF|nr:pilus assembly protein N-terminal domain-containing protein [Sphingobium chlorophenolicum]
MAYSLIVLALALPFAAGAETGLRVKEQRMLSYPRAIGRVEVDREGVLSVAAPSPRSLRLTAIGAGEATVSVFGGDGGLIGREAVRVAPADAPVVRAGEQVVAVDVQFAAVSATTLKALGFNFSKLSGDIQGAIVSPSSLGSASFDPGGLSLEASAPIQNAFNLFLSAPNRGIGAVLSALSSNGLSQLLAQPTLLVRSGEQASFLAGGEFPVPVPQASGSGNMLSIQYKEFGVRLSVTPFVLSKDHIVLKIAPEVSELDYANGVQLQGYVVPGLRRRSAETTVELGSGQSFVIAGLSYSSQTVTKEKTPFLGDLPVLGAFFKRQQNQKEKQELIIVATPRLVTAVKPEEVPPLPGVAVDPGISDMILGTDGLDQASAPLGVVRR